MSGLLRRLTRRRPATADENVSPTAASSEPVEAPAETPAEAGGQQPVPAEQPTLVLPATTEQPATAAQPGAAAQPGTAVQAAGQPLPAWTIAAGQPTAFAAQPAPARDLPAGVDPGDLAAAPAASARRGKLRRRLRYLRHVRELLLRDLGGFTYEVHRTAAGTAQEPQRRLAAAKAQRISAVDAEVLALESRLGEPHAEPVLREPGIGGTCRECGELHASDAHFCSRCGAALDEKARAQRAAEQPTTGSHAVVEPQPASVLWAGGPRPTPVASDDEEAPEPPSAVTSQWLAGDQPTTFDRAAQPGEPAATADEPTTFDRAAQPGEPAATADEPAAATADEAKPEEPAATTDEPAAATADEAKPDEPAATPNDAAAAADEGEAPQPATAAAQAKPKRVSKPRGRAKPPADAPEPETASEEPQRSDFEANGRRDEDVTPPIGPGDPLASPREQGS
jgi:hypothetical protein